MGAAQDELYLASEALKSIKNSPHWTSLVIRFNPTPPITAAHKPLSGGFEAACSISNATCAEGVWNLPNRSEQYSRSCREALDFRVIEEWLSDAPERHAMPKEQQNATTAAIGAAAKTAAASGVEAFDLARLEMATGPRRKKYRPFRTLTRAELVRAAAEIRTVQDKLRYRADRSLLIQPLNAGPDPWRCRDASQRARFAATERAFVRAEIYEAANGALSPNEKPG
jgi:hypothetical protein